MNLTREPNLMWGGSKTSIYTKNRKWNMKLKCLQNCRAWFVLSWNCFFCYFWFLLNNSRFLESIEPCSPRSFIGNRGEQREPDNYTNREQTYSTNLKKSFFHFQNCQNGADNKWKAKRRAKTEQWNRNKLKLKLDILK